MKVHKDLRLKVDMKLVVLVEEVRGWKWKTQKDNQQVHQHLYDNQGHQHL